MENHSPLSDRDVDALLAGRAPSDPALAGLHGALTSLRTALVVEPDAQRVSAFATEFAAVAAAAPTDATPTRSRAVAVAPWRRRMAAAIGLAAVSGLGVAGAAAANDAAPGDLLYGVDQALESVGILDGGTPERLGEAQQVLAQGDVDTALDLVVEALEDDGDDEAAASLHRAAIAVSSQSSGDDVRARVATMLEWMAGQESRGADFGASVSEFARQISGDKADNGKAPETPGDNGNAPETPGDNGNAPETPGDNGNAPETPGDNGNPPETPGDNGNAPETPGDKGKVPEAPGDKGNAPVTPGDKGKP